MSAWLGAVSADPHSLRAFCGSYDQALHIVNMQSRPPRLIKTLRDGHEGSIRCLAVDSSNPHVTVYSGSFDFTVGIWSVGAAGEEDDSCLSGKLHGHESTVTAVCWCPTLGDGRLISGDEQGRMVVWNMDKRRVLFSVEAHDDALLGTVPSLSTTSLFLFLLYVCPPVVSN